MEERPTGMSGIARPRREALPQSRVLHRNRKRSVALRLFWMLNHRAVLTLSIFMYGFITIHHSHSILDAPLLNIFRRSGRGIVYLFGGALATVFLPKQMRFLATIICNVSSIHFLWCSMETLGFEFPVLVHIHHHKHA